MEEWFDGLGVGSLTVNSCLISGLLAEELDVDAVEEVCVVSTLISGVMLILGVAWAGVLVDSAGICRASLRTIVAMRDRDGCLVD